MAFTCKPCHRLPMAGWCEMMFDIGRGSYGRCENCKRTAVCTDCRCDTRNAGVMSAGDLLAEIEDGNGQD